MRSTLVVLSLLGSFCVQAKGTSQANQDFLICYKDKEQTVKVLDVSYDPVEEKRVGHVLHNKIDNVYQVENSLYGEDFFLEPQGEEGKYHISVNGNDMNAYCTGSIQKVDRNEANEEFGIGFVAISFR